MSSFAEALNMILIQAYHNILRAEEDFLQKRDGVNLSIREMHLLEYVGETGAEGNTLGEIADYLKVARPSVTVAVRKLEHKGYLERSACAADGRVVRVSLTEQGSMVFNLHKRYHMAMVRGIEKNLLEDEKELLIRAIGKLSEYFERSIEAAT